MKKAYLFLYNAVQLVGWSYILVVLMKTLIEERSQRSGDTLKRFLFSRGMLGRCFDAVYPALKIFQTIMLLEVVHAAVGLVKSNVVFTLLQIMSRIFITWVVAFNFEPGVRSHIGSLMFVFAWSLTEVIRYLYYGLNLLNVNVGLVTWCRYTFFIILYPMGAGGELLSINVARRTPFAEKFWRVKMPNAWNVTFYFPTFCLLIFLIFASTFPTLYFHMFAQRKKVLNPKRKEDVSVASERTKAE